MLRKGCLCVSGSGSPQTNRVASECPPMLGAQTYTRSAICPPTTPLRRLAWLSTSYVKTPEVRHAASISPRVLLSCSKVPPTIRLRNGSHKRRHRPVSQTGLICDTLTSTLQYFANRLLGRSALVASVDVVTVGHKAFCFFGA